MDIKKGGPTSGNYSHAGSPGNVGGSQQGAFLSAVKIAGYIDTIRSKIGRFKKSKNTDSNISSIFSSLLGTLSDFKQYLSKGYYQMISVYDKKTLKRMRDHLDNFEKFKRQLINQYHVSKFQTKGIMTARLDLLLKSLLDSYKSYRDIRGTSKMLELSKAVIPFQDYGIDDENASWDAPKEIALASTEVLGMISAWYDEDKPDVKDSYKLPHHRAEGEHEAVWDGVVAAMSALLGARGGVDISNDDKLGVYNHLSSHYEQFDKNPPEFKG